MTEYTVQVTRKTTGTVTVGAESHHEAKLAAIDKAKNRPLLMTGPDHWSAKIPPGGV